MNIEIIETNGRNADFKMLINALDEDLTGRYGGLQKKFDEFNKVDSINDVIVLYKGEIPAACGAFKEYDADTVELKRIFVKSEYRKQGLAKILLNKLEELALEKGFRHAVLETGMKQHEAISLYSKSGYGTIPNYGPYIGNTNSICMRKTLSK